MMDGNFNETDASIFFKQALDAHSAGNLISAKKLYQATLALQPDHSEANHNIGVVHVVEKEFNTALEFFKLALNTSPNVSLFWASYIDTLIKLEKIIEARTLNKAAKSSGLFCEQLATISKRLEVEHQEPSTKNCHKISELLENENFEHAKRECETLIETYPTSKYLNNNLARCYFELGNKFGDAGRLKQAIESFKQVIKIMPACAEAYYNMGRIFHESRDLSDALEAFYKALTTNPDYAEVHYSIGIILKDQGKLEEATEAFNTAVIIAPGFFDAYAVLGNVFLAQGQWKKAIKAFKNAIRIKPNVAAIYNNLGKALQKQVKLKEAIASFHKALELNPDYVEAHYNLGNVLYDQGKPENALKAFNKALAINPNFEEAKHIVAALSGKTPDSVPRIYVKNLFDEYATNFEYSLVNKLEYNIPRTLTDMIIKNNTNNSLGSILDIGCGTGLIGMETKRFCKNLEGIDLSGSMLGLAREKNIYNKLTQFDVTEYLSSAELDYDYFIAADVFIYVGELSEVFRLIKSRNNRSGKIAFSTEHTERDGFYLVKSKHYSHSKKYIESLCKKFGYSMSCFSKTDLRKNKGKFLTGGLYLLEF